MTVLNLSMSYVRGRWNVAGTHTAFLKALDVGNIPYADGHKAILQAHMVCSEIDDMGYFPTTDAVGEMNLGWTAFQQGFFVGVAVRGYCSQYTSDIPTPKQLRGLGGW